LYVWNMTATFGTATYDCGIGSCRYAHSLSGVLWSLPYASTFSVPCTPTSYTLPPTAFTLLLLPALPHARLTPASYPTHMCCAGSATAFTHLHSFRHGHPPPAPRRHLTATPKQAGGATTADGSRHHTAASFVPWFCSSCYRCLAHRIASLCCAPSPATLHAAAHTNAPPRTRHYLHFLPANLGSAV